MTRRVEIECIIIICIILAGFVTGHLAMVKAQQICTMIVNVLPAGSGTVTLSPSGGSYVTGCYPGTYKNPVDLGTPGLNTVSATASASSGYYFVGWGLNATSAYIQSQSGLMPHSPDPIDGDTWAAYYTHLNPATIPLNATSYILTAYFQKQNQWVRSPNNPVLTTGPSGSWDSVLLGRPRPFVYPNGTYGMLYNGGDNLIVSHLSIGLSTSTDGVHWTKYAHNPVLSPSDVPWVNGTSTYGPRLRLGAILYDGVSRNYILYFTALLKHDCGGYTCNAWYVGRATSADSIHWTVDTQPLNLNSALGSNWDRVSVLNVGGYKMWVNNQNDPKYEMYYFTSSDGITWTSGNGGNAVFGPTGNPTDWDGNYTYEPYVLYNATSNGYTLFYTGCDAACWFYDTITWTGYATSTDGINWMRYSGNPILGPKPDDPVPWDNGDSTYEAGALQLPNHSVNLYYAADGFSADQCVDQIWPGPHPSEAGGPDFVCDHAQTMGIGLLSLSVVSQVTITVNYSVIGSGSPSAPVFTYIHGGASMQFTLTTTPTGVSVDAGSSWSVSNPLQGSTNSERWWSTQKTKGTASAQSITFAYQHQYHLTMNANPSGSGTTNPKTSWQNAAASVSIQATPSANFGFLSWTGSGTGSYSGTSNPSSVTMNGPVTETASFQQTGGQLSVSLLSPRNGVTVASSDPSGSLLVFIVKVQSSVQGATVTVYLDGNQVCSGPSDPNGYFVCGLSGVQRGNTHSWYATASKNGFTSGTSPTWTFTY